MPKNIVHKCAKLPFEPVTKVEGEVETDTEDEDYGGIIWAFSDPDEGQVVNIEVLHCPRCGERLPLAIT